MSKKEEDALALMAKLAAQYGQSVDVDAVRDEVSSEIFIKEERAQKLASADGVLMSLHYPHKLMMKRCERCNEAFQTNYCYVSLCSMTCRKLYFKEKYGIGWEFTKTPTFGEYEPPMVVDTKATEELFKWATAFVADYDRIRSLVQEQVQSQEERTALESILEEPDDLGLDEMPSFEPLEVHPLSEDYEAPEHPSIEEQESEEFEFDF